MTVYIVQELRGRDLSDASQFGELEVLIPAGEGSVLSVQPLIRRMLRKLTKFTDNDYLLLSGDPAAIAIAASLAAQYNRGRYQVLKWDRIERRYLPLLVDLNFRPVHEHNDEDDD